MTKSFDDKNIVSGMKVYQLSSVDGNNSIPTLVEYEVDKIINDEIITVVRYITNGSIKTKISGDIIAKNVHSNPIELLSLHIDLRIQKIKDLENQIHILQTILKDNFNITPIGNEEVIV